MLYRVGQKRGHFVLQLATLYSSDLYKIWQKLKPFHSQHEISIYLNRLWKIKWRHLANVSNHKYNNLCYFSTSEMNKTHPQQRSTCTTSTLSTEHAFYVCAVLSHYELHTTAPFTDVLLSSMKDRGNASMIVHFSSSTQAKLSVC